MKQAIPDTSRERIPQEQALKIHPDAVMPTLPAGDLWVFGYGSLMWRQGFESVEQHRATLFGYHRSLCVSSHVHRGTAEVPGLVLGLDRGGSCRGRVFRVAREHKDSVAQYLYAREMPTAVYSAKVLQVKCADGRTVSALTFVVDRAHQQYLQGLSPQQLADIVDRAAGISGTSADYLASTLAQLKTQQVRDRKLEAIASYSKRLGSSG
ncbi:MAG: gamma-glutamylcyclotransferase [Pseudomonadales bacterium]